MGTLDPRDDKITTLEARITENEERLDSVEERLRKLEAWYESERELRAGDDW